MTDAFRALRKQTDDNGDEWSIATATINEEPSLTRGEFKDDADINRLLARFGVNQQVRQDPRFTEVDYNLDLQQAYAALDAASRAQLQVPEELRSKYPDWLTILNGAESGEYQRDLQALADRKAAEAEAVKKTATDNAPKEPGAGVS